MFVILRSVIIKNIMQLSSKTGNKQLNQPIFSSVILQWSRKVSRIGGPGPIATYAYINILQGHS